MKKINALIYLVVVLLTNLLTLSATVKVKFNPASLPVKVEFNRSTLPVLAGEDFNPVGNLKVIKMGKHRMTGIGFDTSWFVFTEKLRPLKQ